MTALCCGQLFFFVAVLLGGGGGLTPALGAARPIDGITDNSFLIEEAYNQDPGVVQHLFTSLYGEELDTDPQGRGWRLDFTQEWPVFSQRHQFSYTLPVSFTREGKEHHEGLEDLLLHYRLQVLEEGQWRPAFAPRFSLLLPTGSRQAGTGYGVVGFQWNLPMSKKLGPRLALHVNLGLTYLPEARISVTGRAHPGNSPRRLSPPHSLVSYNLGVSGIVALSSRIHFLLEWVGEAEDTLNDKGKKEHDFSTVLSPGLRAAVIDRDQLQVVLGVAVPIGLTRAAENYGVFLYCSLEHSFL